MERMSSVFVSLIMVIAFSMGCSVKEDRSVCPCVMMLDFSGVDPDRTDSLVMSVLSADGFIHKDTVFSDSFAAVYEVPVPRGGVQVNIYSVENGQEVDPALFADAKSSKTLKMRLLNKLVWGMVLFMTGAGMLVGAPFVDDPEGLFITGGICAAVGAALLVAFFVGRKWMKPEIESEERQMASRYGKEVEGK